MKDYLDIDALLQNGLDLSVVLAAGRVIYGNSFNPLIALKALSYFDDVPTLPHDVRKRLLAAVEAVDPVGIPTLTAHIKRAKGNGHTP